MPKCGSQILFCEVPVRFDTYKGCAHLCQYCFSYRKGSIENIATAETPNDLRKWIAGERTSPDTKWCDWNIPLHWGGMSDPFQPIEAEKKRSLECLRIFAETGYPFIVSTKNKMIAEGEYFDLLVKCNCVVQFSAISPAYDKIERGASTYAERLDAARKIAAAGKRVILRMQPYTTQVLPDILNNIPAIAEAGVHGVIVEGIKYFKKVPGMIAIGGDYVYPRERLVNDFLRIKEKCHEHGLVFYCGENRLRRLGDHWCCCGTEGMGWQTNKTNILSAMFGQQLEYTPAMLEEGAAMPIKSGTMQTTLGGQIVGRMNLKEAFDLIQTDRNVIEQVIGELL